MSLRRVVPVGEVCFDHGRVLLTYSKESAESLAHKISVDIDAKVEFDDVLKKIQEAEVSMEPEHWASQQTGIGIKMKWKQAFIAQIEAERVLKGKFAIPGLRFTPATVNGSDGQPVTGVLCDDREIPSDVRFDLCTVYTFTEKMHKTNHVTPHNTFRPGQALERHEASCKRAISDRPPALQLATRPPSFRWLVEEMKRATTIQAAAAEAAGLEDVADVTFVGASGEASELPQVPVPIVKRPLPRGQQPSAPAGASVAKRPKRGSPPAGARSAAPLASVKKEDGLILSVDGGSMADPLDDVDGIMHGTKIGRELKGVTLGKVASQSPCTVV